MPGVDMETTNQRAPMFSNRALLNLGIPLALSSLMTILMGTADSIMVSTAGAAAVSAVSIVDAINAVFTTAFDSIPIGGSVVTSQYIGAKRFDKAKECVSQILYAVVLFATLCMVLLLCFRKQVLNLIYGTIEPEVFNNAVTYFTITLVSYPFLVMGCTATATLRAGQAPLAPLISA
jgi:Na+-driven multidrug efflux pump